MSSLHLIKNVHGTTVDLLGHAIISGSYAVGSSLPPEPLLCEQLGVSRTVVREAVKSLVAKGLIITGPKLGTRVLPEDQWNWFDPDVISWQSQLGLTHEFLKDLQDLRRVVEPAAVRMAAGARGGGGDGGSRSGGSWSSCSCSGTYSNNDSSSGS